MNHVALLGVSALATLFDLRARRIPNPLTYGTLLVAVAVNIAVGKDLLGVFGACALAFALFFPMYWAGGLGGGDVKLAVALAAILATPGETLSYLLLVAISGGVLALGAAVRARRLGASLRRLWSRTARAEEAPLTIAYAPAFLIAAIATMVLR